MQSNDTSILLLIVILALPVAADEGHEHGDDGQGGDWQVLFDGTSAQAWRGYNQEELPDGWVVEEGVLLRKTGGGDIVTRDKFADFELVLEWKIAEAGNSGVMYRVSEGDRAPYESGPEYQLLDNEKHADNSNTLTRSGALYGLYETDETAAKPAGEWNQAKIVLHGNHIEHWLNGKKVVDCELGSDDWNERMGKSKFSDWPKFAKNRVGHIALQDHGDQVWFRNIRVRPTGGGHGEHRESDDHDEHERLHRHVDEHHDADHHHDEADESTEKVVPQR